MMSSLTRRLALALLLSPAIFAAHADNTAQTLPFSQDWSNTGLITTNDDWSGVPGIVGYRGDDITSTTGADPQTLLGEGTITVDVNAQAAVSSTTGGLLEIEAAGTIALQGSGTADAPNLVINLDTTGQSGIAVAYALRDLDASADDAQQAFALQYRVGDSGNFTNVPSGFVADATTANSATQVTQVSAVLPAAVDNQALVQVRIITSNASGNDELVGVDDISITSGGSGGPPKVSFGSTSAAEGDSGTTPFFFTISSNIAPDSDLNIGYATQDGTATTADNDYVAKSGTATIAAGTTSVTISVDVNGDTTTEPNETFSVVVTNAGGAIIANGTGTGTINNDDVTVVPIHDIQGNGSSSPLVGQTVTTRGIVTGRKGNGFFIQAADADVDADPMTSEGVYVFTSSAPPAEAAVGNLVQVTATISEYSPTQDPLQPPLTELGFATVVLLSTGNALPAPVPLTTSFPDPEGAYDQLERVEGMRVSAASLTVVGPTDGTTNEPNATGSSNGVFYATVTGDPRPFRTPGIQAPDPAPSGSIPPIPRWDTAPETMEVDSDALGGAKLDLAAGAVVTGVTGPMDYGFRRYTILPEATPTVASTGEAVTAARLPSEDEFTVAGYNLERFFDTVNDPAIGEPVLTPTAFTNRLNKASLGIRDELHAPDVLAVMEVENLSTLQQLASKINSDAVAASEPDPQYVAYLQEGNDVGGIDVGFLVKTAPVDGSTPRVEVVDVTQYGKDATWFDPSTNTVDLLNDRPPLLLRAIVHYADGRSFPVSALAVHQRSLNGISDETMSGSTTVGDRVRQKRLAQAEFLATSLIDSRQRNDPNENLIVLGDFNAFDFNDGYVDPMAVVTGLLTPDDQTVVPGDGFDYVETDLLNLHYSPAANQRYSYVFDGQAQSLDHILINQALITDVTTYDLDHARMNADFPETNRNDPNSPSRLSDHDPAIAYFAVPTGEHADLSVETYGNGSVPMGQPIYFTSLVSNQGPDAATNPGVGFAFDQALPDLEVTTLPEGWTCGVAQVSGNTTTLACNASSLAADSSSLQFQLKATATANAVPGTLTIAVAATSETDDPDPANNADQGVWNILPPLSVADLSIRMTRTGVTTGSVANFRVPVANAGPDAAEKLHVTITANVKATPTIATPSGWTCQRITDVRLHFECIRTAAMASGQSQTIAFSAIVPRKAALQFDAIVYSDDPNIEDPDFSNNTAAYTKP